MMSIRDYNIAQWFTLCLAVWQALSSGKHDDAYTILARAGFSPDDDIPG